MATRPRGLLRPARLVQLPVVVALAFLSTAAALRAQQPGHFTVHAADLDKPPRADFGGHIDVPWRVHLGDDPAWASPQFDDSSWELANPAEPLFTYRVPAQNEERVGRRGIVWMRVHLHVDSAAAGRRFARALVYGPTELYVDGALVKSFGNPALPARGATGRAVPGAFPIDLPAGDVVLAVRQNLAAATDMRLGMPGIRIALMSEAGTQELMRFTLLQQTMSGIAGGILLALGALQLLLFGVLRSQRIHLYHAGFALALCAGFTLLSMERYAVNLRTIVGMDAWGTTVVAWALYLMLAFLYLAVQRKPSRHFRVIGIVMALLTIVLRARLENWASEPVARSFGSAFSITVLLIVVDAARLLISGIRRRVEGAWILASGLAITLTLVVIVALPSAFGGALYELPAWLFNLGFIAIPLAASLHLARQTARNTQRLATLSTHLEEEVAARTAELREARVAADQANRAKSDFLANMSHELRTPLNAIIGYSEMLTEEAKDSNDEAYLPDLEKIRGSGKHLLGLINDILDLTKIEAGRMELFLETFELAPVIMDVEATIRPLVERNANTLTLDVAPNVGTVRADQVKVRQVLLNLLSNAGKFTTRGSITLSAMRAGRDLVLEVSDTGIGMTEEQVAKIFQPFVQAEASTTRKYGGTGLGLTITKRIVEMMGGTIAVESRLDVGTTFRVRLPLTVVEPTTPADSSVSGATVQPFGIAVATVLVIDDDATARDMIGRMLAKEGYRVVTAASGAEWIRLAEELKPDAITLDIMMTGMDGWGVLARLKADPALAGIPVVVITIVDDRNLSFALGASDYITKPIDREQLVQTLQRVRSRNGSKTVMVVEDDADARRMMRRLFEKEGWTVIEAENGRVALETLETQSPGLVLLDLMMPEMDGFEFIEHLRRRPDGVDLPVVVLTAKDLTEADRHRLRGSVENVLQKGGNTREVVAEVRRVLDANSVNT